MDTMSFITTHGFIWLAMCTITSWYADFSFISLLTKWKWICYSVNLLHPKKCVQFPTNPELYFQVRQQVIEKVCCKMSSKDLRSDILSLPCFPRISTYYQLIIDLGGLTTPGEKNKKCKKVSLYISCVHNNTSGSVSNIIGSCASLSLAVRKKVL